MFSILSKSKSYRHCTFRKSESRPTLSVTCAVASSVSDIGSSEYVLEGSRAFVHNCLKDVFTSRCFVTKSFMSYCSQIFWITFEAFYVFLLKFTLGYIVSWIMNTVWIWRKVTFTWFQIYIHFCAGILAQLGVQAQLNVFRQSILLHGSHLI